MTNKKLQLISYTNSDETIIEDLTYKNLTSMEYYRVINKNGNVIVSSKNDIPDSATVGTDGNYSTTDGTKYIIVSNISN